MEWARSFCVVFIYGVVADRLETEYGKLLVQIEIMT